MSIPRWRAMQAMENSMLRSSIWRRLIGWSQMLGGATGYLLLAVTSFQQRRGITSSLGSMSAAWFATSGIAFTVAIVAGDSAWSCCKFRGASRIGCAVLGHLPRRVCSIGRVRIAPETSRRSRHRPSRSRRRIVGCLVSALPEALQQNAGREPQPRDLKTACSPITIFRQ